MFSSFKNYILVLFGSIQERWKSRSKCDVQINNLSYLQLNITDGYLELSLPRLTCSTLLKLPAHFQNRHIHTECALEVLLSKISGNPLHPAHEKLCYNIRELFQNSLHDANVPQTILSSYQSAFYKAQITF